MRVADTENQVGPGPAEPAAATLTQLRPDFLQRFPYAASDSDDLILFRYPVRNCSNRRIRQAVYTAFPQLFKINLERGKKSSGLFIYRHRKPLYFSARIHYS